MRKYIAGENIKKGQLMYFDPKTGTVKPVEVAKPKGSQVTDTYWDEFTQMEQQYEVCFGGRGQGKKAAFMKWVKEHENDQPVPFSKEYYGRGNGKSTKTTNEMINNLGKIPKEQYTFSIDAPEHITEEEYTKLINQIAEQVDKMNDRYNGLYSSVYTGWFERAKAELKKRIIPKKRKWTEAEIQEAKNIVYEAMTGIEFNCITVCSENYEKKDITATLYGKTSETTWQVKKTATAKCCSTDTYRFEIGYMVAVCKVLGHPLPTWFYGGKK